ncbi:putative bifunctional diguanylate cyclase/phosphodiesterase [Devosia sp. CN2-171]|uniref:putative bifunctional diguanylate cyclase/phosphodiesterase n=1 Tax=Devosia sp. CN2-171 TaxID=3400909 RepID=UPI003BF7C475
MTLWPDFQTATTMPTTESAKLGRKLSLVIMTSVLVVFAVIFGLLGSFVLWTADEVDEDALDRQSRRVAYFVRGQLDAIPYDQQSITIWDDMLVALRDNDERWLHINVGKWTFDYFGHDESYILAGDQPVYASVGGEDTDPDTYERRRDQTLGLVEQLRGLTSAGYVDVPPFTSDFVLIDGKPAIISVSPIVSDTGNIQQQAGREPLLVSVVHLDSDYELRLIQRYQLEAGHFTSRPGGTALGTLPVTNRAGRIVTFYEWQPYRPGETLMQRTTPALAGAFIIILIVVIALLAVLWRSSSALESKSAEAERQASIDLLTGLPNRLNFDRQFEHRLSVLALRDPPLALMMLDLDRFKQVNDTLGHHAGDELIRAVGERLAGILGPTDVLARLGGDEFAILHICHAGSVEVSALAQRIVDAIARPFRVQGTDAFVGVSIGIVITGAGILDSRELSRKADIALYEAKSGGRNRAAIYEQSMDELVQGRHVIEAELREALRAPGQLWVAFQPLCGRDDGQIIGAEALLRWTHPTLGVVAPLQFIAIAESTGLIEQLGEFVLRRAAQFGARWPHRTIAVNISPAQLRNPTFPERVFAILDETGMEPSDLEMEITEGILLDDESTVARAIHKFRQAGISIALDDFGTGYSSLNYLKRYPVDRIKIDRSFVSQLTNADGTEAIIQAMVTLAHALGIEVTAEGVETEVQYRILAAKGCNTFQGYLFSPPLTVGDMTALLTGAQTEVPEVA